MASLCLARSIKSIFKKKILNEILMLVTRKRLISHRMNLPNVRNFFLTWQADSKKRHSSLHWETLQFDWANVPDNLSIYPFVLRQDESDTSAKFLIDNSGCSLQLSIWSALIKSQNMLRSNNSVAKIHVSFVIIYWIL